MAATSVYTPTIDEKKWVSQGNRALDSSDELAIQIDFTPSIFQIPKPITETKPEAYAPQHLGLGAYHHLRPELHVADMQKLAKVKKFLSSSRNFSDDFFLGKTKGLEPAVRASYDKYLDLEGSTLDYIIAVDSLFLLDFLGSYDDKTESENLDPGRREFAKDVSMLENQVPAFAVAEMGKQLDLFSPEKGTPETMLYSQLFYYFCKAHSPLKLAELWKDRRRESKHLLAHMYNLIVNNHGFKEQESMLRTKAKITEIGTEVLTALTELGFGGPIVKSLQFTFKSVQVWENSKLAAELSKDQEPKAKTQKIQIPSVSDLSDKYKVEFKLLDLGGIRHIKFEEEDEDEGKPTIYLPEITLKHDSEVVLRNLIAYEAAISTPDSSLELSEYIDLMCGIVHTDKDVSLLREKGIVKSDPIRLNDERAAEIFNGFSRSAGELRESESRKVVKQVKEMVEKWENKKPWKRVWRFLEKNVKNVGEFLRKPSGIAMKFLLYIFMALLLVLQIMQAYCQIYGCKKGESGTKAFSLRMSG
ncbi:PREDICTED: putative UPF0481 protein At3g02645 [Ipomoea nil]|uniref:putative UPF0481 protein At3g02645 n=1 Tax=Ipomoea nil TaxID=35883 RepID=UPI000901B4B6|nr:PREDICTED: putative UPF0481 protein At3g02645 [Ipomoea nil]